MRIEIDETCYARQMVPFAAELEDEVVIVVAARARDPFEDESTIGDLRQQLRNAERERDALQVEAASKSVDRCFQLDHEHRIESLLDAVERWRERRDLAEERLHPESRRVLNNELLRLQRELDQARSLTEAATRQAGRLAEERNEFRNALDAAHKAMRKTLETLSECLPGYLTQSTGRVASPLEDDGW